MTCAFVSCLVANECGMVGGCVTLRFSFQPEYHGPADPVKKGAPAEVGTKKRVVRDPRFIKRKRKALTP